MLEQTLVAARFFQFAAALIVFGLPLFVLYALKGAHVSWARGAVSAAAVIALAASIAWVMAQTALLMGEPRSAFDPDSLRSLLWETRFGRFYLFRIVLLLFSLFRILLFPITRRQWTTQAILGGAIVASFAWSGHGTRDEGVAGAIHLGADVAHLLAAGIWMGALVGLGVLLGTARRNTAIENARCARDALEGFSGIGSLIVAVLVLTGLVNSWFLIGPAHWQDLFDTAYGLVLLVKLALFLGMLVCASLNRFLLTPRLAAAVGNAQSATPPLLALEASLFREVVLGFLVLGAVAYLGTLNPPIAA